MAGTTTPISIAPGTIYTPNPVHRNATRNKSQWTIPLKSELDVFKQAFTSMWLTGTQAWGLYIDGNTGSILYLGVAQDHMKQIFIAKFVDGTAKNDWHGYPADHGNSADTPDTRILNMWLMARVLSPAKIRKIGRGQPCNP
jgi:hypothetical protein